MSGPDEISVPTSSGGPWFIRNLYGLVRDPNLIGPKYVPARDPKVPWPKNLVKLTADHGPGQLISDRPRDQLRIGPITKQTNYEPDQLRTGPIANPNNCETNRLRNGPIANRTNYETDQMRTGPITNRTNCEPDQLRTGESQWYQIGHNVIWEPGCAVLLVPIEIS